MCQSCQTTKNVSTPNPAESSRRRMGQRVRPMMAVKDQEGNKSSTVCPRPSFHLWLQPCECARGRQLPRSPNNTSSHPENLPFQTPVACVCLCEDQLPSNQSVGPYSVALGHKLHTALVVQIIQRLLGLLRRLTMMTRRICWKLSLWSRAQVRKRAKFDSSSCKNK